MMKGVLWHVRRAFAPIGSCRTFLLWGPKGNTLRGMHRILAAASTVVLWAPLLQAAEIEAGTARAEITPPAGLEMGGYGARKGVAKGAHDPLYATVLVLKSADQSLALITFDLVTGVSSRVENEVRHRYGISNVLLSASHTHSGPDTRLTSSSPPEARRWWRQTEDKFIELVGEANSNLFPARLGAGTDRVYVAHNRRKVLPDGTVKMFWRNAEKEPTHAVDPTVSVLRVDDSSGRPKAVLVNYSCHPTVLGPDNLDYSADYVGAMRSHVEEQTPGATVLFVFGASGNINPYFDKQPISDQPFEKVRWTGEILGKAVVETVKRIETEQATETPIQYGVKVHEFEHRFNPAEKVKIASGVGLLNGKVGFVTFSADPFVEHQIRLRDKSDVQTLFVFAHTTTEGIPYARYLPTIRAAVEGGYGAGYATLAEVGAGEMLVDKAVVRLLELMELLSPVPDLR